MVNRFVYFIESGFGGPVKIGMAANPSRRLEQLQTGNPIELHLLAVIDTKDVTEAMLHLCFQDERIGGEWFHPSPRLWQLIRENWAYDDAHGERDPVTDYRTLIAAVDVH